MAALLSACSTIPSPVGPSADPMQAGALASVNTRAPGLEVELPRPELVQSGKCSWYGPKFHGRLTSNGERFDQHKLTAAHPSLPFGTIVEVTDVDSGRRVRVRINDRGPYVDDRIVDLSRAAAKSLGILDKGVAHVELRLVDENIREWPATRYAVQVGAYKHRERALKRVDQLLERDVFAGPFYIKEPDRRSPAYRVRVGPFEGYSHAVAHADELRSGGLAGLVVEENHHPSELFGVTSPDDGIAQVPEDPAPSPAGAELARSHSR